MIDLHNHLLPGIDDGPHTLEESVESARRASAEGVRTIAATPHVREDHPNVRPEELEERCEELRARLAQEEVAIEVVSGGEVDLTWALDASDDDLRLVSYGQRGLDLLVETPYAPLPSTFEALLFDFQVRGYRILLAHPERNPTFRTDPERLDALVERGVLIQVTGASLAGGNSRSESRRVALDLIRRGRAHVIASDSHGRSVSRPPLSAAVGEAEKRIGERARWMVSEAPAAILAGEPLGPPPEPTKSKRLFPWRGS
jgi:protein-tyrosine phosphatase